MQSKFSLIIPCYNESAGLEKLVSRCAEVLLRPDVEIILVDNGSKDDTPQKLAGLLEGKRGIRTVRVAENQGYGFGILSGLRAAEGAFLGWTHADLQTDPADGLRALELIEGAADSTRTYVKGRRYGRPMSDVVFTVGMSFFETAVLKQPLWDINAQPNVFSREFFESWKNPPHDFSLDLFAYYQAKAQGLEVVRFPVHFGRREFGQSSWNINWSGKRKFIERTVDFTFKLRERMKEAALSAER